MKLTILSVLLAFLACATALNVDDFHHFFQNETHKVYENKTGKFDLNGTNLFENFDFNKFFENLDFNKWWNDLIGIGKRETDEDVDEFHHFFSNGTHKIYRNNTGVFVDADFDFGKLLDDLFSGKIWDSVGKRDLSSLLNLLPQKTNILGSLGALTKGTDLGTVMSILNAINKVNQFKNDLKSIPDILNQTLSQVTDSAANLTSSILHELSGRKRDDSIASWLWGIGRNGTNNSTGNWNNTWNNNSTGNWNNTWNNNSTGNWNNTWNNSTGNWNNTWNNNSTGNWNNTWNNNSTGNWNNTWNNNSTGNWNNTWNNNSTGNWNNTWNNNSTGNWNNTWNNNSTGNWNNTWNNNSTGNWNNTWNNNSTGNWNNTWNNNSTGNWNNTWNNNSTGNWNNTWNNNSTGNWNNTWNNNSTGNWNNTWNNNSTGNWNNTWNNNSTGSNWNDWFKNFTDIKNEGVGKRDLSSLLNLLPQKTNILGSLGALTKGTDLGTVMSILNAINKVNQFKNDLKSIPDILNQTLSQVTDSAANLTSSILHELSG